MSLRRVYQKSCRCIQQGVRLTKLLVIGLFAVGQHSDITDATDMLPPAAPVRVLFPKVASSKSDWISVV